jgi:hypothetical protein
MLSRNSIPRYLVILRYFRNKSGAMSFTVMVSGAYLRQQAEILIAMSRGAESQILHRRCSD